jgi:hypothetical protein
MDKNIYHKSNYIVDIPLMINASITEYDISAANITMLLSYGLITQEAFYAYKNMDKMMREISVGKLGQEPSGSFNEYGIKCQQCIAEGIGLAKKMLFDANHIKNESVVRIAKDAVYINGGILPYTSFDINKNGVICVFVPKNYYNIMINLNKSTTIFINDNPMTDSLKVDVVGINNNLLYLHQSFLEFICNLVSNVQRSGKEYAFNIYNSFYEDYINMRLPVEYYREFNANSGYRIKHSERYTIDSATEVDKDKLDINYNLSILRTLYSAILDL